MKGVLSKIFPLSVNLYRLHSRNPMATEEFESLENLYFNGNIKEYRSKIYELDIKRKAFMLETVYAHPRLLREDNYSEIILSPYTQDVPPDELKYIDLRTSLTYLKWQFGSAFSPVNYVQNVTKIDKHWEEFFNNYTELYHNIGKVGTSQFILSLMYSEEASIFSKRHAEVIEMVNEDMMEKGIPNEILLSNDATRMLLKKSWKINKEVTNSRDMKNFLAKQYANKFDQLTKEEFCAALVDSFHIFTMNIAILNIYERKKFADRLFECMDRILAQEPAYINTFCQMLGSRLKNGYLAKKEIQMFNNRVSNPESLTSEGLAGYCKILNKVRDQRFLSERFLKLMRSRVEEPVLHAGLYCAYLKLLCLPNTPDDMIKSGYNLIKKRLASPTEEFQIERFQKNSASSEVVAAVRYLKQVKKVDYDIISKLLDISIKTYDITYCTLMIDLALFLASNEKYNKILFWNKFFECSQKPVFFKAIKGRKFYSQIFFTAIFLKEERNIDLAPIIGESNFKIILDEMKKLIDVENPRSGISQLVYVLKRMSLKFECTSEHYWLLPLALPERKIGFVTKSYMRKIEPKSLERIFKKNKWEIYNITGIEFEDILEVEDYLRDVLNPKRKQ